MAAILMLFSSCVTKKSLLECQNEKNAFMTKYEQAKDELADTKAKLAAAQARIQSLTEQLAQQKADQAALQQSLDKSLTNTGAGNVNISKLVDQIHESKP